MKKFLLLSATITPPQGVPALARVDPATRMADYAHALSFYITQLDRTFDGIVFTENSESDLTPLKDLATQAGCGDKVEFLSFNGLDHPAAYGRGYGEFKLMDFAMKNSKLIAASGPDAIFWKCTGRYIVHNIDRFVRTRPDCRLYCHLRNYPYRLAELFMMSWDRTGYEQLIEGVYTELRNDIVPGKHTIEETLFRKIVDASVKKLKIVRRFRLVPLIEGIRGWNNSRYSERPTDLKILARRVANRIAPWLWI